LTDTALNSDLRYEEVSALKPEYSKLSDPDLQAYLLQGVSRTFALTIPLLPSDIFNIIANAYLLCRIVDTIEDEPALTGEEKRLFCLQFENAIAGKAEPKDFARELSKRLSNATIPEEHELIDQTPRVIKITQSFDKKNRDALKECIHIMADGMVHFQIDNRPYGLQNIKELDRYCYCVAGVVGEMLTKIFCHYSSAIALNRDRMLTLSVSFGQGLQMTNILKDIWEDNSRSACWLPKDIFAKEGIDLKNLATIHTDENFSKGLGHLIGIAHMHLENALKYVMLIPKNEKGIRKFCLWNIGMAILTLRKINYNRQFTSEVDVKISRLSVKGTILATHLTVRSNQMLKLLFNIAGMRLPYVASGE
jgi:farnesyl-diphosphate farnesyltransferase